MRAAAVAALRGEIRRDPDGLRRQSGARGPARRDPRGTGRQALRRAARGSRAARRRGRDLLGRRDALLALADAARRRRARTVQRRAHGDVPAAHRRPRCGNRPGVPGTVEEGALPLRDQLARPLRHARARGAPSLRDAHHAGAAQPPDRRAPAPVDRARRTGRDVRPTARARARARRALAPARDGGAERRGPGRTGEIPALRPTATRRDRGAAEAALQISGSPASMRPIRRS